MEFQTQLSCVLLSFSSSDIFSNKGIFHFFVSLSFLLRISFPFMFCKLWVLWLRKNTIVSVEVNISIYCYIADIRIYLWLDNELDRKIDVTAILLVENRHQTHDWTLIGSGANGLGILEWESLTYILLFIYFYFLVVSHGCTLLGSACVNVMFISVHLVVSITWQKRNTPARTHSLQPSL